MTKFEIIELLFEERMNLFALNLDEQILNLKMSGKQFLKVDDCVYAIKEQTRINDERSVCIVMSIGLLWKFKSILKPKFKKGGF